MCRFEWRITGLPICYLSGALGPYKLTNIERLMLTTTYIPWAYTSARTCEDLMSYHYEENLSRQVIDIQREMKMIPAPEWKY